MTWTKHGAAIVGPSEAWELDSIQEIDVMPDPTGAADWRAFYMGGWVPAGIGTAISNDDGMTWTKDPGNPVLGLGAGGIAHSAGHYSILQDPTDPLRLYCFFTDPDNGPPVSAPVDLLRATSTDGGLTWGSVVAVLDHAGWESGRWGNSAAHIDNDGTWHLLYEAMGSGFIWQMGYATSPDGVTFTRQNGGNPIATLRHGSGMYGGPDLHVHADGTLELFYHASVSGNLPTRIHRALSTDWINWTKAPDSPLVVASLAFEVDQVADPSVVTLADGTRRMFYSGLDNPNEQSRITFADEDPVDPNGFAPLPRDARVAVWHYQGESSSRAALYLAAPDVFEILPTSDDFPGQKTEIGAWPEGTVFTFAALNDTGDLLRSDDPYQALLSGSWETGYRIDWETITWDDPSYNTPGVNPDYDDQVTVVSIVNDGFGIGRIPVG